MLRKSLGIALRLMRRHKGYTAINIVGLSIGFACCLLIFLFVQRETTFDTFHENADRLFRLYSVQHRPDGDRIHAGMSMPVAPAVEANVASVEHAVRTIDGGGTVQVGDSRFQEGILFVDESFFDVFTFSFLEGDPASCLSDLGDVVISRSTAVKYFGDESALGRTMRIRIGPDFEDFAVTGVTEDPPDNSSVRYRMVVRFEKHPFYAADHDNADSFNSEAYVLLTRGADPTAAEREVERAGRTVLHGLVEHLNNLMGLDPGRGDALALRLEPIEKVHLDTRMTDGRTGNPVAIWVMSLVAMMVLGSGCINFVNLSIGRASTRLREIGVRKAVGAARTQLMQQFWTETALLSGMALLVGVGLARNALPYFNRFLRMDLSLDPTSNAALWLILGVLFVVTAVAAGGYPALYLSGFRPSAILAGRLRVTGKGRLRDVLIVLQFALAVILVTALVTMNRQLQFLRSADPGFDEEQVVSIPVSTGQHDNRFVETFKQRLTALAGVVGVTAASNTLGLGPDGGRHTSIQTFTHVDTDIPANILRVDPDYLDVLGLSLVWGRSFTPLPADRNKVIVNETLERRLGEPASGNPVLTGFSMSDGSTPEIIGVVKDFNFEALRNPIEPLVMFVDPDSEPFMRMFVRIRPENAPATLASMERIWQEMEPDQPFRSSFLDEDVDRQYTREARIFGVAGVAMTLAMLIACFGLLGLAVLEAARRTKEIGIRKTLGASVPALVRLLSFDFLRLVLVAFVVASVPAWYLMDLWLSGFAYRIRFGPGIIVLSGLAVLLISWMTVAWQAVKAAVTDPVRALRYE